MIDFQINALEVDCRYFDIKMKAFGLRMTYSEFFAENVRDG